MKNKFLFLSVLFTATSVFSAEHVDKVDDFTNENLNSFIPTYQEFKKTNIVWVLTNYDESDKTVEMRVSAPGKVPACSNEPVLIKSSDGVISKINFETHDVTMCWKRISVILLKKSFSIRLPIYQNGPLDGSFDTSTLDPKRLAKLKQK